MKNEIQINNQALQIKEYKNQRVVTFSDIDTVHECAAGTAKRNFFQYKSKLINGEDYYEISRNDVGTKFVLTYCFDKKAPKGILITESGYLMLVKSLTDDLAWEVQRKLVNEYFKVKDSSALKQFAEQKAIVLEARQRNARSREANMWLKLADRVPLDTYKQILYSKSAEALSGGEQILPLPEAPATKTYTAAEVGKMAGISANMVGR